MEFMAIEVLLNINHTYQHDFESFFYVLIWQCARHGWGKNNHPKDSKLRAWYIDNYENIANTKLGHMSKAENMGFRFILREFPPNFHDIVPFCRSLREYSFLTVTKALLLALPETQTAYTILLSKRMTMQSPNLNSETSLAINLFSVLIELK